MVPAPLRVCRGCGLIAPTQRSSCASCETAFGETPLVAAGGVGSAVLARVSESDFECRGCGLRGPLTLGFAGEVDCRRCGLRQAFAAGQWEKALHGVHAVADLTGPDPEGRFAHVGPSVAATNPHATVGVEHTRVVLQENSMIIDGGGMQRLTLRVVASPGHPLCEKCHLPLGITLEPDGKARTRCPSCSDEAVYALPAGAGEKAPALRAVIGKEHRVDQPVAKMGKEDAAGVAAMLCPSCGAALPVTGDADLATCTFCHTTSRLARRAWARASGDAVSHDPFWVLLDGPSKRRRQLEGGASGDDDDDVATRARRARAMAIAAMSDRARVPAPRRDWGLIRMIVAGIVLLGVVLFAVGQKIYASVRANEAGSRAPAKPRAPSRPTHR